MGGDARRHAVRRFRPCARERVIKAEPVMKPRHEMAAAHIREQTDARFRHGEQRRVARHAKIAVYGDTDAPAHDDPVDELSPKDISLLSAAVSQQSIVAFGSVCSLEEIKLVLELVQTSLKDELLPKKRRKKNVKK